MSGNPLRRYLERSQINFLEAPFEVKGHSFSDGAVQIIATSDLCFTSLQLSRESEVAPSGWTVWRLR